MKRFFIIGSVALLLAACQSKNVSKQDQLKNLKAERDKLNEQIAALETELGPSQKTVKLIPVSVAPVTTSDFKNYIEVQGRVDAEQNVGVTAEVPAVVTAIYVHAGQHVSKGQTLAQLDDKVLQQQIAQTQNQLDFTKNLYEKQQNLWKQNIGTEVQLLTAKNTYENIQKQLAVLKSQLNMYRIKSPIDGTVDNVDVKIGQAVQPGLVTMRVVNMSDLKVKGEVGESYVTSVNTGDAVELIFPDAHDTLHTRLTYAGKVIDPSNRSFGVEIRLPRSAKYHPNMLAVIRIVSYRNEDAVVVPVNLVQHAPEGDYVYISDNNKAKRAKITVGQSYNGYTEIRSGLQPGDHLITTGSEDVTPGDTLQIVQ